MTTEVVANRAAASRCIQCNHVVVEAWICEECTWGTSAVAARNEDDRSATTATSISRSFQWRVDCAAAHDQLAAIQSITEFGVSPESRVAEHRGANRRSATTERSASIKITGENERSVKLKALLREHHMPGLTLEERKRLSAFEIPDEMNRWWRKDRRHG